MIKRRDFIKFSTVNSLAILQSEHIEKTVLNLENQAQKALVFLFQGDSITDGNRGRNNDPNHIMGHGYAYSVASRIGADFSEANFTFFNRGISGNTIKDLQKRWQTDALDLKPDVLSILVGINDSNGVVNGSEEATTITQFETIYRDLLKQSRLLNPHLLLILGLPFAYHGSRTNEKWAIWAEDLQKRQAVVRQLAVEFDAVLIDFPTLFNTLIKKPSLEYWIWDGVHPSVFGHEMMARLWLKEVSKRLKFLKKIS
jgi:lysophospholipase L1-like esterase